MRDEYREVIRECVIKGKRVGFDACAKAPLKEAKQYYKNFNYIGFGKIAYYNGVRNVFTERYYFFVRKQEGETITG